MKIDPRVQSSGELQSDRVKDTKGSAVRAQSDAKSEGAKSVPNGDTVQLSSRHSEIQQLSAQAANVPDVRVDRVAPLQAKVRSGGYQPDSQKVADAMLTEQTRQTSKA
ncbi:MAG TPA: flagellar biosynthesis anti-sigma factor FlgM [Terracidiphilus sp.]|nr:flagellar biosynthesis anti-sigma factor FlgM [Terracidiphilus sp.]